MYLDCIGSPSSRPITILERRVEGLAPTQGVVAVPKRTALGKESSGISSHSTGVVAVPRDVPKVLSLPGLMWGTFGTQSTDIR